MRYKTGPSAQRSNVGGEPFFAPGGLKRLVVFTVAVTVFYWVASTLGPVMYYALGGT